MSNINLNKSLKNVWLWAVLMAATAIAGAIFYNQLIEVLTPIIKSVVETVDNFSSDILPALKYRASS
ncbi:MAG: hypothetical protein PHT79_10550 [Syntrophomonadaceae bacterium]|nr:hypothetical protein [Syntrophomonadaceae bacterium]MDD4550183.1 hypothetical protein [Syntrophomonadaceae bacterium]